MASHPELVAQYRRFHDEPDGRWLLAGSLAASSTPNAGALADQEVLDACAYRRHMAGGPDHRPRGQELYPHIAAAEALHADEVIEAELKVLVVGDCPRPEIAARLHLDEKVVATWELLFFDVRAMRTAWDWILTKVIQPEEARGNAHLAAQFKYATNGPMCATAVLDAGRRVCLRQGQTLLDLKIALMLKFEQAVQLPLDSERAKMFFIKRQAELLFREKQLRLAELRLEQRSLAAVQQQERAEHRQMVAAQRRQQRAARAQQKQRDQEIRQEAARERQARKQSTLAARLERQRAAWRRAEASSLAELRWEYSEAYRPEDLAAA